MKPFSCLGNQRFRSRGRSPERMFHSKRVPGARDQEESGFRPVCNFEQCLCFIMTDDIVVTSMDEEYGNLYAPDPAEKVIAIRVFLKIMKHRNVISEKRPR